MDFGEKIKRIMFENNLTQQQFAQKIGSKHPAVSRWINGTSKNPTLETLEKISKAFNIPVSYLSDDSQNDFEKCEEEKIKNNDLKLIIKMMEKQNKLMEKLSKKVDLIEEALNDAERKP